MPAGYMEEHALKNKIVLAAAALSLIFAMPAGAAAEMSSEAESSPAVESAAATENSSEAESSPAAESNSEAESSSETESAAATESIPATESVAADATADAVSSASQNDFYTDFALFGDELMNAVNEYSGFYVVATANEDGTPQLGYFVYSMLKDGDAYYVMLGLEENQTRVNLERTGRAEAIYAARPADDEQPQYAVSGARMELELVTDEELTQKLNTEGYDTSMFLRVTEAKPLG